MAGLKVRLDDGSEVGPMDLEMVQTWFSQGLISGRTLVQKAGAPRWVRLAEAVDLRNWQAPRVAGARRPGARGDAASPAFAGAEGVPGRWRLFVASGLLLVLAAAAFLVAVWPDRLRPELDGVPWIRVGLALCALGLLLVRAWDVARRIVRLVALLAAAAALPMAGLFVARGMRGEALATLASAWLLVAGLVGLLAPRLPWLPAIAALVVIGAGGAGLVRFAPAEGGGAPAAINAWAAAGGQVLDAEIGLSLALPRGWVVLKPGNPLVPAPAHTRVALANPRVSGYALLLVQPPPSRVLMLEHYLDHVITQRRLAATAYDEDWRRDGRLGAVASRRAAGRRAGSDGRFVERAAVAQDGDRYFALVAWVPEAGGGRALEEIDALEAAITLSGVRDAGRRAAVQTANLELPHLSLRAIERLVELGGPAAPGELFRRAVAASARGIPSLAPGEAQELQALTGTALVALTWSERSQLGDYLRRAAAAQATQPDEDERMRTLMKTGSARLGESQRARLGALHGRAIEAALAGP